MKTHRFAAAALSAMPMHQRHGCQGPRSQRPTRARAKPADASGTDSAVTITYTS